MDPLVLNRADLSFLSLAARYAPEQIRQDLIFNYFDFTSRSSHRRHAVGDLIIEQRGTNPQVEIPFARCLSGFSSSESPEQSLAHISQCINQTNATLWRDRNNAPNEEGRIPAQICTEPSEAVIRRQGMRADHPSLRNCRVTREQTDPIQVNIAPTDPNHPALITLSESQQREVTEIFQEMQREFEAATRCDNNSGRTPDQQYQDVIHADSRQNDLRVLRSHNATEFSTRINDYLIRHHPALPNETLLPNEVYDFIHQVRNTYHDRLETGVTYSGEVTPRGRVSFSPEHTINDQMRQGLGMPRISQELFSNTILSQVAGRSQAFTWYDTSILTNSRGLFNWGAMASLYYNRFTDNTVLWTVGPQATFRLPWDRGMNAVRVSALFGSVLNGSADNMGNIMMGGALGLVRENYDSLCNPLAGLTGLSLLYIPHSSRCIDEDTYRPTFPTNDTALELRYLRDLQNGDNQFFITLNLPTLFRWMGASRPETAFAQGAGFFYTFSGLVAPPRP